MKTTGTFQVLTALGWLGIAGLQHFYLGNTAKGLIWLLTFGFCGIGTLVDHLTAAQQVRSASRVWPQVPYPGTSQQHWAPMPPPRPEVVVNVVSPDGHSNVTAEQIKAIAGGGLADALRELNKLRFDRLIDDAEFAALKSKLLKDYS